MLTTVPAPLAGADFEYHALLPGPTRKRLRSPYAFRLTYRSPRPEAPGCVLLWEVLGGRSAYQIALERRDNGGLRWHCTCADAVYRGENAAHVCKHVRGLQALGRQETNVPPSRANCVGA